MTKSFRKRSKTEIAQFCFEIHKCNVGRTLHFRCIGLLPQKEVDVLISKPWSLKDKITGTWMTGNWLIQCVRMTHRWLSPRYFFKVFFRNVLIFFFFHFFIFKLGSRTLLCLWWGQVWSHFWRYLVKTHPSKRLSRRRMANQIFHFNWSKSQCQLFVREPEKKEKKF